jgi:hypothetical protein
LQLFEVLDRVKGGDMKSNIILTVLLASVFVIACDNSGSTGSASSSTTVGDCSEAVDRAVRDAGPDDSEIIRARDKALEDCMAGN